jgi:hypothetical protein
MLAIFSLMILFLGVNGTANNERSIQSLYTFVRQNPRAIISYDEFDEARGYLKSCPMATLKSVSKIGCPKFNFILAVAWPHYTGYDLFRKCMIDERSSTPEQKTILTFKYFNQVLKQLVFYRQYQVHDEVTVHLKIIRLIALILKKTNYSDTSIKFDFYGIDSFSMQENV